MLAHLILFLFLERVRVRGSSLDIVFIFLKGLG